MGELTPEATRSTEEFSRSLQATAGRPHRWGTKSRTRPSLISSCTSWCKRKRAVRAHGCSNGPRSEHHGLDLERGRAEQVPALRPRPSVQRLPDLREKV